MKKGWIQSKTVWGVLLIIAASIMKHWPDLSAYADQIFAVGAGVAFIGLRTATQELK